MTSGGALRPPRRLIVPKGWLGAWYGTWPLLAIAAINVTEAGRQAAIDGGSLQLLAALTLARGAYWGIRRRRNRVEVDGAQVRLVIRGKCVELDVSDIRKIVWCYGVWSLTLDPLEHVTELHLTLSDDRELCVDLWLPRKRGQRKAFQRLADSLPPVEWTVRWPYSVLPKKERMWHPAQGRVPR